MIKIKSNSKVPLVVFITYFVMILVNALANILPINGRGTGDISDSYENLFAPAPLTFSIWGLIYILLFAYVIYQLTYYKESEVDNKDIFRKIGLFFSISSITNALWIFAWHYDKILISLVLMIVILANLIIINIFLRKKEFNMRQQVLIRLPFTIYLGWITVATIANITTYLVGIGWNQFGIPEYIWTIVIILTGATIGISAMFFYNSIAYGFVIIWAYVGIAIKHLSDSGFNGEYMSVIVGVFIAIALLVAGEARLLYRRFIRKV